MRRTSGRRRSGPGGIPVVARARRGAPVRKVEYEGADAVTCPRCGIKVHPSGRSKHNLGGVPTSQGGVPCIPSDANGRGRLTEASALPVVNERQARARRLVSLPMVARRFQTSTDAVGRWTRERGFPEPVAILDLNRRSRPERLWVAAEVEEWATRGPGKSKHAVMRAAPRLAKDTKPVYTMGNSP